jgi:Bacteriophage HK97-gp10, putative tail-component
MINPRGYNEVLRQLNQLPGQLIPTLSQVVKEAANIGIAEIIDKVSGSVRPHMATRGYKVKTKTRNGVKTKRKIAIKRIVTDLVDTGSYLKAWQVQHNVGGDPLYSQISNNMKYAAALEFGRGKMPGFHVTAATEARAPDMMARLADQALNELLK